MNCSKLRTTAYLFLFIDPHNSFTALSVFRLEVN